MFVESNAGGEALSVEKAFLNVVALIYILL